MRTVLTILGPTCARTRTHTHTETLTHMLAPLHSICPCERDLFRPVSTLSTTLFIMVFHSECVQVFTVRRRRKEGKRKDENKRQWPQCLDSRWRGGQRPSDTGREAEKWQGSHFWNIASLSTKWWKKLRIILVLLKTTQKVEGNFQKRRSTEWKWVSWFHAKAKHQPSTVATLTCVSVCVDLKHGNNKDREEGVAFPFKCCNLT